MEYNPEPIDAQDFDTLVNSINRELQNISNAFLLGVTDTLEFKIFYVLPERPSDGVLAYIDSTADASITTSGLHEYRGGAWQKL